MQIVSYEFDSNEIDHLTEHLFEECKTNIFPHVKVNLQSSTSSWSRSDDANSPLVFVFYLNFMKNSP